MGERHVSANEHTKLSGAEETGGRRGDGGLGARVPGPGSHRSQRERPPHRCDQRPPSSRPSREAGNLGPYVTHPDFQTWSLTLVFCGPGRRW